MISAASGQLSRLARTCSRSAGSTTHGLSASTWKPDSCSRRMVHAVPPSLPATTTTFPRRSSTTRARETTAVDSTGPLSAGIEAETAPPPGPVLPLGRAPNAIGEAPLDPHGRKRATRLLYIRAHAIERVARLVTGLEMRKPAVRDLGDPLEHGLGHAAHPYRDGALDGQRVDSGPIEVMIRTLEVHHRLGPELPHDRDLLADAAAPRVEVLVQRLVLDVVPADATPRRRRPPVRTSTAAACLATNAVCRWGRMTIPVTSSRRRVQAAR